MSVVHVAFLVLMLAASSDCHVVRVPLDRIIHRSAVFSTRDEAREAISAGRVGYIASDGVLPADVVAVGRNVLIDASANTVLLDGHPLPQPPPTVCIALHKPGAARREK